MPMVPRWACMIILITSELAWSQDFDSLPRDNDDATMQRMTRERMPRQESRAQVPTSLDSGASVNPILLEAVRDNSTMRPEERDLYFRMLELSIRTPLVQQERFLAQFQEERGLALMEYARAHLGERIEDQPTGLERNRLRLARGMQQQPDQFPTFQDLVLYPDENRGRLCTIHGVLRRLTKFGPEENDREIGTLYEGWIFTDGNPSPTVVVFIDKPEHLQVGGDLAEEVQVTGYFFKLYAYQGQESQMRAPLILAGGLLWHPQEKHPQKSIPLEIYLLIGMLALLGGYAAWQSYRREMTSHLKLLHEPVFITFSSSGVPVTHVAVAEAVPVGETDDS